MASSTSDTGMSFWIKFFKDAGIPAGDAANYAVVFTDNRISRAMLMDLNKEYLNDMGISILGDVISILKHAKTVFNQDVRDRALRDTSGIRAGTPEHRQSPVLKRSTPASRTIAHHIGSERSASPSITPSPKISKALSARLGTPTSVQVEASPVMVQLPKNTQKEEVPVPRKRRVFPEHEGPYKITMPKGTTLKTQKILEQQRKKAEIQRIQAEKDKKDGTFQLKTSVFSRLGSEKPKSAPPSTSSASPTITITGLGNINLSSVTQSSVFARLGGKSTVKRAATSTVILDEDDLEDDDLDNGSPELEYAGVLKSSPSKKAKKDISSKEQVVAVRRKESKKQPKPQTAGFLSNSSKMEEKTIKSRLGPKIGEVSSTTSSVSRPSSTKISLKKTGVQNRLGTNTSPRDFTITVDTSSASSSATTGVFKRLGKSQS